MSAPPPGAMKALLQTLFVLIHRSLWIHDSSCSAVMDAGQPFDEALKVWKPAANQAKIVLSKLHSHWFGLQQYLLWYAEKKLLHLQYSMFDVHT